MSRGRGNPAPALQRRPGTTRHPASATAPTSTAATHTTLGHRTRTGPRRRIIRAGRSHQRTQRSRRHHTVVEVPMPHARMRRLRMRRGPIPPAAAAQRQRAQPRVLHTRPVRVRARPLGSHPNLPSTPLRRAPRSSGVAPPGATGATKRNDHVNMTLPQVRHVGKRPRFLWRDGRKPRTFPRHTHTRRPAWGPCQSQLVIMPGPAANGVYLHEVPGDQREHDRSAAPIRPEMEAGRSAAAPPGRPCV